jgi:hypothetical protein
MATSLDIPRPPTWASQWPLTAWATPHRWNCSISSRPLPALPGLDAFVVGATSEQVLKNL